MSTSGRYVRPARVCSSPFSSCLLRTLRSCGVIVTYLLRGSRRLHADLSRRRGLFLGDAQRQQPMRVYGLGACRVEIVGQLERPRERPAVALAPMEAAPLGRRAVALARDRQRLPLRLDGDLVGRHTGHLEAHDAAVLVAENINGGEDPAARKAEVEPQWVFLHALQCALEGEQTAPRIHR